MPARLLVVDDNPTNLKLACSVLEMDGYDVEQAQNAEQALEIVGQISLDLILMDIELPGMDGLTLTRLLKLDQKTKDIPVVALSAFAMKGDDEKALQAGCIGYITKPIDTRTLKAQVEEFLAASRLKKGKLL